MSGAFSFSAPRFTIDDERREVDGMSLDEREEVRRDLYGTYILPLETDERIALSLAAMQECITLLPEKEAYEMATQRCPGLFTTESAPIRFLRSENYNPEQAALRMIMYWKERMLLFDDRAFLPLTLEDGALRPMDVDALACGHIEILPDDDHNRLVLVHDRSRFRMKGLDQESVLRSIWYVIHAALEAKEEYCRTGVVYVIPSMHTIPHHFSRKHIKRLWFSVRECFPVKLRAIHACHPCSMTDHMLPVIRQVMGRDLRRRWQGHTGTKEDVLSKLEGFGLKSANLPRSIGGMWNHTIFQWIETRRHHEQLQAR